MWLAEEKREEGKTKIRAHFLMNTEFPRTHQVLFLPRYAELEAEENASMDIPRLEQFLRGCHPVVISRSKAIEVENLNDQVKDMRSHQDDLLSKVQKLAADKKEFERRYDELKRLHESTWKLSDLVGTVTPVTNCSVM